MKLIFSILICFVALYVCSPAYAFIFDKYDVKVKVIDDNGVPVEKASVYIGFDKDTLSGTKMTAKKSITAADGEFRASGTGNGYISYGATKEGYYKSHYTYSFPSLKDDSLQKREFIILLRKIGNPVPMYARDTKHAEKRMEIPVVGKKVGFDLIAYDWVQPYGKGTYEDFVFYLERIYTDWNHQDCKLTITFANKFDGIQKYEEKLRNGSEFKLPRFAPVNGYQTELQLYINADAKGNATNYNTNMKEDDNYIFKIRSKDMTPIYGKIRGSIWFWPQHSKNNTATISMKYYVNPDRTNNLEFDPTVNLFGDLPFMAQVIDP
jgi:hypothetical protein